MSCHQTFPASYFTPLFPGATPPVRRGVYRVTEEGIAGGSYEYWNGEQWQQFGLWSRFSHRPGFRWHGLNRAVRRPEIPRNYILK